MNVDVEGLLERTEWEHQTPSLQALGFSFSVRTSSAGFGRYVQELLEPFKSEGPTDHIFSIIESGRGEDPRYEMYLDQTRVVGSALAGPTVRYLLWHINREVVDETSGLLLLHAAGAERDGDAIIFPAGMNAGKTTLVAGLVRAGLRYLTDETIAIDPDTLEALPYPKPLTLDPGSWGLLRDLEPELPTELTAVAAQQWHVPPTAIRDDAIAPPSTVRLIITPRYESGSRTELRPLSKEEALVAVGSNSFNIEEFGREEGLRVLAALVRRSRCYSLELGSLDEACRLVVEALEEPSDATNR